MADKKVMVVDDDAKTVELVKLYLDRDGYQVLTAYNGLEALRLARESCPDLIVLDLMLPDIDGLEICRTLRRESDVPIIMVTARTTDHDKLAGLDLGADDYVTKPFSPKELLARVRAVLRRLPGERGPEEVKTGRLSLNFATHEAWFSGKPLNLTSLIEEALGYDFEGFDRTIDVHILNLRRKLESDPSHPNYIKTVYGVGYKFVGGEQ
jgi:two-component system alkaline phosphatase synthesis response regulator PhoP